MKLTKKLISKILEGALFAEGEPVSSEKLRKMLPRGQRPPLGEIREVLESLKKHYQNRGVQLVEVASGFRFQVAEEVAEHLIEQREEKPMRLSKAFMETLALVAYRQPITRGEIEDIRGVAVSSNIIKGLQELEWIREVGHKDVPGKPALFATTKKFLDFFNLQSLEDLPPLTDLEELSETRLNEEYSQLDEKLKEEFESSKQVENSNEEQMQNSEESPSEVLVQERLEESEQSLTSEEAVEEVAEEEQPPLQEVNFVEEGSSAPEESQNQEAACMPDDFEVQEALTEQQAFSEEQAENQDALSDLTELEELEDTQENQHVDQVDAQSDLEEIHSESLQVSQEQTKSHAANHRPLEEFTEIVMTYPLTPKKEDADSNGSEEG